MATVASGRTTCPRCGANNFETQAACWKCGAALGSNSGLGGRAAPSHAVQNDIGSPLSPPTVDPAVAHWVGAIGGLLIPIAMLPVGLAFLMWDDRRKVEVGRTATIASLVGTLFHAIFTYFAIAGALQTLKQFIPGGAGRPTAAQSEPAPNLNSEAKPLELPGIPSLSPKHN